jgi:hypothetical protein
VLHNDLPTLAAKEAATDLFSELGMEPELKVSRKPFGLDALDAHESKASNASTVTATAKDGWDGDDDDLF